MLDDRQSGAPTPPPKTNPSSFRARGLADPFGLARTFDKGMIGHQLSNRIMKPHRFLYRSLLAGLVLIPGLSTSFCAGQEILPEPAQVFSPKTALGVYLDLERASQSGIWKSLEARLEPLKEQLSSLPQMKTQLAAPLAEMSDLQTGEPLQIAIAIEGQNAFKNMETEEYDPDFGVVAAVRFKEDLDQQKLITQILDEADKQQSGLRAKLEDSHKRVGAVDWFDLPPEALANAKLPFALSLAIGPGKQGSMIGVGKSDSLRKFVAGETNGRLPAGIGSSLAQRGQMWLYFPISSQMLQEISAGAGGQNNPVLAGLGPNLEKIREFGLGMSFGNSAVGVEMVLGCADAGAANQLQQGLQQFVTMMQMMATQNPSMPKLVSRLKTSATGPALRLTTEVTVQDVDLALKSSGIKPVTRMEATPPSTNVAQSAPSAPPATVEFLGMIPSDEEQLRYTRLRITNNSSEPVKEIHVTFTYFDRAGRKVGSWTRRHQDPVSAFLAPAQSTREIRCPTFHVPSTTARVGLTVHEILFADGKKWTPSQ